mgnify:CR=1 FL=1
MRSPTLTLGLFLTLIFIGIGDLFLPQPLASASYNTRTQLNSLLVSLLPGDLDQKEENLEQKHFRKWQRQWEQK